MRRLAFLYCALVACVPPPSGPVVSDVPLDPTPPPPPAEQVTPDPDAGSEEEIVPGCGERIALPCDAGTVCDQTTGQCVPVSGRCASDAECGAPSKVCESGQCIPGCGQPAGVQCNGAMTCNASTGRCEGEQLCLGDLYEDNDTLDSPRGLSAGLTTGLFVCPGDDDYYAVGLARGGTISATATFSLGEGNIDLELYDAAGTVVASSQDALVYTSHTGGNHVLRVFLANDAGASPGVMYDLDLEIIGVDCRDDMFEENDLPGFSFPLPPEFLTNLHACPADDDYYTFSLQAGAAITVVTSVDPGEGTVGLELVDLFGFTLATGISSAPGQQTLTYTPAFSDIYYVRVWLLQDAGGALPGNAYSMTITLGSAPATCTDLYEDNDTQTTASPIGLGRQANLTVCNLDDDYYSVSMGFGETLNTSFAFSHAEGDIDVSLLDALGFVVASSESAFDQESFTYTAVAAGTYTIRVYLYSDLGLNIGNRYELTSSSTP